MRDDDLAYDVDGRPTAAPGHDAGDAALSAASLDSVIVGLAAGAAAFAAAVQAVQAARGFRPETGDLPLRAALGDD